MSTSGAKTPNMSNKWWTSWRSSWGHQSLLQEDPPVFLASTQGLLCKPEDTLCEHPSSAQMAFARVAPTLWNFITMRQARLLLHNPQAGVPTVERASTRSSLGTVGAHQADPRTPPPESSSHGGASAGGPLNSGSPNALEQDMQGSSTHKWTLSATSATMQGPLNGG